MTAALTAAAQPATASVVLDVTDWAEFGPMTDPPTMLRTDANGTTVVRLREGQAPIDGAMTVIDYEPALVGPIGYSFTYLTAGGTIGYLTASTTFGAAAPPARLASVQLPQIAMTPPYVTGYSAGRASTSTVHRVIGRTDPVVVLGALRTREGRLETRHADHADALAAADVLSSGGVVLFRQPTHPGLDMYLVASRVSTDPLELSREGWRWQTTADYVEVRSPNLPLLGAAGWSYADVPAEHGTYAEVLGTYDSYADFVVGP